MCLTSLWDLVKWLRWPWQQIFAGRVAPTHLACCNLVNAVLVNPLMDSQWTLMLTNMDRHRLSISLMASIAIGAKYVARLVVSSSVAGFI